MSQDFEQDESGRIKKESCPKCKSDLHEMILGGWRCVLCGYQEDDENREI